jgi:hypothetical protein
MPLYVFRLLRYGSVACAFLIAAALPLMACNIFYRLVFNFTAMSALFWTGLLLLLPPAIFLFGAAVLLGRKSAAAVYVLLAAVLIVGIFQIPLPPAFDIIGSSAVRSPGAGACDFVWTPAFVAGRIAFSGIGTVCIIASLFQSGRNM